MARIEEREFTDIDGSTGYYRVIEADHIRIEHADGTVEDLQDLPENVVAEEWPPVGGKPMGQWTLFQVPVGPTDLSLILSLSDETDIRKLYLRSIELFNEHGETLLKLFCISLLRLMSDAESTSLQLVGFESNHR